MQQGPRRGPCCICSRHSATPVLGLGSDIEGALHLGHQLALAILHLHLELGKVLLPPLGRRHDRCQLGVAQGELRHQFALARLDEIDAARLVPHVVATVQEIQLQAAVNELLLLEWLAMAVMLLLLCCCLTD